MRGRRWKEERCREKQFQLTRHEFQNDNLSRQGNFGSQCRVPGMLQSTFNAPDLEVEIWMGVLGTTGNTLMQTRNSDALYASQPQRLPPAANIHCRRMDPQSGTNTNGGTL